MADIFKAMLGSFQRIQRQIGVNWFEYENWFVNNGFSLSDLK